MNQITHVSDLANADCHFTNDSSEVAEYNETYKVNYDSYFVFLALDGRICELYGCEYTVPYNNYRVYLVELGD